MGEVACLTNTINQHSVRAPRCVRRYAIVVHDIMSQTVRNAKTVVQTADVQHTPEGQTALLQRGGTAAVPLLVEHSHIFDLDGQRLVSVVQYTIVELFCRDCLGKKDIYILLAFALLCWQRPVASLAIILSITPKL